jgi:ribosome biogenesis protein ERB1
VEEGQLASWQRWQGGGAGSEGGVSVLHKFGLKHVTWHARGDYFATTAPAGNTQARFGRAALHAAVGCCGTSASTG